MSSKRQKAAEEKEYHDFLFDVANSAMKILKDETKRKKAEATRAKMASLRKRNARKYHRRHDGIVKDDSDGNRQEQQDEDEHLLNVKIPRLEKGKPQQKAGTSSLPALRHEGRSPSQSKILHKKEQQRTADIIAQVKRKLRASPLSRTESNLSKQEPTGFSRKRGLESMGSGGPQQQQGNNNHNLKPVKILSANESDQFKMIKKLGHFAPGTVPVRAEHAVPRRLQISEWLDPKKTVSIERGISQQALQGLAIDENELQGLKNWSTVDLRMKYRDEIQRTIAWKASTERELEAQRLRFEEGIFIPVVVVKQHPLHVDFYERVEIENRESIAKARGRAKLRTYSYDLPVIWQANRPQDKEETLLLFDQEEDTYPPKFSGVHGLNDRRDRLAHEGDDCQVQSVTHERAMKGAFTTEEKVAENQPFGDTTEYINSIRKKLEGFEQQGTVLTMRNMTGEGGGAYYLEKVQKRRHRQWNIYEKPYYRILMFVDSDGALKTKEEEELEQEQINEKDEQQQDENLVRPLKTNPELAKKDAVLISLYKMEKRDVVDPEMVLERNWVVVAYACSDSTEYQVKLNDEKWNEFIEKRKLAHVEEHETELKQFEAKVEYQKQRLVDQIKTAREKEKAKWWFIVTLAAKTAHFGSAVKADDQYAKLAGFSPDEARGCIQLADQLRRENEIGSHMSSTVHRQAVSVPVFENRERTDNAVPCLVLASLACLENDDASLTAIVFHIRELLTQNSHAIAFSLAALHRWMRDTRHTEETDLPPSNLSWWFVSSEWKSQLMSGFFRGLCFDQTLEGKLVPFVPNLAIAQAAVQFEHLKHVESMEEANYTAIPLQAPVPREWTDEEILQQVLVSSGVNGGLGVVDCLFEIRRVHELEKVARRRRSSVQLMVNEKEDRIQSKCLALAICGRTEKDNNFIGDPCPSTSLLGQFGLVPCLFVRDPKISSTNSVTCTVSMALDSPLLSPVVLGFNSQPIIPTPAREVLDLSPLFLSVAPYVVKRVISKLDFRESCTIVFLNRWEMEDDIVSQRRNNAIASAGHRRMEPEITQYNFRVRLTSKDEEVPRPDAEIYGTVFGITQAAATLNSADTWPHRYTWHSDDLVFHMLVRQRVAEDYAYVSSRGATVGSNDPNGYRSDLRVEDCESIVRISRTMQIKAQQEMEERLEHEEKDKVLRAQIEAARANKAKSEERRAMLDQELNDKRLQRERRLRGKTATHNGSGASLEDWIRRREDPSTKKLGRWKRWQAYLYLDNQAKAIVIRAAQQAELDQLARIAAGERPKSKKAIQEEAFDLAVKEGTLFYHETLEDVYQWDQPEGWEGVATLPVEDEESSKKGSTEFDRPFADRHLLRGDEDGLDEDAIALKEDYDKDNMEKKKQKELQEIRAKDAKAALVAAKEVEHARRLRFVEENVRAWLDTKALSAQHGGAFDMRVIFKEVDDDETGVLAYEQFKLALADLGLKLPSKDQKTLIKHLDKENDDVVDYVEFINWALNTRPDSYYQWVQLNLSMPELGPNTWLKMRERDTMLSCVALFEEYKDADTGQHYFHSIESGEFTWLMPDMVYHKMRQDRDAMELRQAQAAASLAAKAAAESAEQAERASERSMDRIVEHLSTSSTFVQLVAEKLGLQDFLKQQEKEQREGSSKSIPSLSLKQIKDDEERDDGDDDHEDEDNDEHDDELQVEMPTKKNEQQQDLDEIVKKPGQEWRILKPGKLKEGFITKASRPNTRGADMTIYSRNMNRPSLVGVVDPADVSHIPFEDIPPVVTSFISDIMAETMAKTDQSKDQLLDRSEEDQMLEMIQDAFLACRNLHLEKLEEYLDLGVKITEADENGNTLLIIAAQQGSKRIVKFLLRRGADINAQNLLGNTALHFCFQYSFNDLAEYLISKGANDSLLNKDGLTCYEGLNADLVDKI